MALSGHVIHRCKDEYGRIEVFEDVDRRFLSFDSDAEQSCVLNEAPWRPIYEYIQAMCMASLFCAQSPKRALVAGLGGGSLVHSLLHILPELELHIVELRPAVAEVAKSHFHLDKAGRYQLHIGKAEHFIEQQLTQVNSNFDLIFSDLYGAENMDPVQLHGAYLRNCHQLLSAEGVLCLNLWVEEKSLYPQMITELKQIFSAKIYAIEVPEGNLVLYLFKQQPAELSPRRLLPAAKRLGKKLRAPLTPLAALLRER